MYRILKNTFDSFTQKAEAINPSGQKVQVHGTYCWAPGLTFYDDTAGQWITSNDWEWVN